MSNDADRSGEALARLRSLADRFEEQVRAKRRRQNVFLGLAVGLAVVCAVSFARLTVQTRAFDAESVTRMGRVELQRHLPATARSVGDRLEAEAPRLVGDGLDRLVASMPTLRSYLLKGIQDRLEECTATCETHALGLMEERVVTAKRQIDTAFPNLSERERLERLLDVVAERFNQTFGELVDRLYPSYAAEVAAVEQTLVHLRNTRPAELDPTDRKKREIIETVITLAIRDQAE